MARRISDKPILSNPRIFGEDVGTGLEKAGGALATAVLNDKVVAPNVQKFMAYGGLMAKVVDAATTFFSAWAIGEGGKMIDNRLGNSMHSGAMVYFWLKAASIFIPGVTVSINASLPGLKPGNGAPKALGPGNGTAAMAVAANQRSATRSSGL